MSKNSSQNSAKNDSRNNAKNNSGQNNTSQNSTQNRNEKQDAENRCDFVILPKERRPAARYFGAVRVGVFVRRFFLAKY